MTILNINKQIFLLNTLKHHQQYFMLFRFKVQTFLFHKTYRKVMRIKSFFGYNQTQLLKVKILNTWKGVRNSPYSGIWTTCASSVNFFNILSWLNWLLCENAHQKIDYISTKYKYAQTKNICIRNSN